MRITMSGRRKPTLFLEHSFAATLGVQAHVRTYPKCRSARHLATRTVICRLYSLRTPDGGCPEHTVRRVFSPISVRVLLQRVTRASVSVDGRITGQIGRGYLALVGFTVSDDRACVDWMTDKVLDLRLFPDDAGKMNLSLRDVAGELLVVSQFTLYGDARNGRRPSFVAAARPEAAIPLYEYFLQRLRELGTDPQTGEFGAMMQVELVNDGPVTLMLER